MPVVRVYVPVSRADLAALADGGALSAGPGTTRPAYAVTSELARLEPSADSEDLEYTAFVDAVAAASAVRERPRDRRVVASADANVSAVAPAQPGPVSRVALTEALPLGRVASFHIDEAEGVADGAGVEDLLWYDVTELADVRSLLDG